MKKAREMLIGEQKNKLACLSCFQPINKDVLCLYRRNRVRLFCLNGEVYKEMTQMVIANIALDLFGIVLSLIPIIYLLSGKRYRQQTNGYFLGIALANILMLIGDLADWFLQQSPETWQKITLTVFTVIYFISSAHVLHFFSLYIITYTQTKGKIQKICLTTVTAACAIQVILALISPFTGAVFYVNDNGYQRGPLFAVSQFIPLFCYLSFMTLVIISRKKLKKREIVFFLLYTLVPLSTGITQMFIRGIALVNVGIVLALLFILINIQFEHEMTLREQEKVLAEQRIDIMLSQIQPHFLYNSLAIIHHLCQEDPMKARKLLKEFSEFLRANMNSLKAREPIPFEKELKHAMNYLYLEQQRLGDRLHVVWRIQTTNFLIPPLTLQPLVENAVQHGIFNKDDGGTIVIATTETDPYVVVSVEDNGVGFEKAKQFPNLGDHACIGIENVRSRLKEMVNGRMEIESSDQGTLVTLLIPWTDP